MSLDTIFFDLGRTLIYQKGPWPPVLECALKSLLDVLLKSGITLDATDFVNEFGHQLDTYYARREADHTEPTMTVCLREFLATKDEHDVPDPILRAALDAMFAVTQTNWHAETDALPTLQALHKAGYRLGIVSNAADDKNVQQIIDRWGFRPYFELVLTSAICGIRKPASRIFQIALDHFSVSTDKVFMVGDTLEADIEGANRLGIYSIWITRRAEKSDSDAKPKAIVKALDEIPPLLEAL
jgi:HAD superfamily hydrolase (TIGR01662 family)